MIRPLLRRGRVPNIGGPLIRPNLGKVKKSVTDVSAMSPDMLVIAFHFSPLNVNQTCFQVVRWTHLACSLHNEVRSIKSQDRNNILQTFG